jgi:hypothetical protein
MSCYYSGDHPPHVPPPIKLGQDKGEFLLSVVAALLPYPLQVIQVSAGVSCYSGDHPPHVPPPSDLGQGKEELLPSAITITSHPGQGKGEFLLS